MPSPEFEAVRSMLASAPKPDPSETPAERRARLDANAANTPLADGVVKESVEISGVPGAAWLRPESHDPDGLPALLFFHGGGYRVGSIISHQGFGSHLASLIPARVLMIDYRLAPEDPFPAAVDDCVAAYRWMLDTGIDPARIAYIGDSAGGGLVGAVMLGARNQGLPLPGAGVCLSPWVDLTNSSTSHAERDELDVMFGHDDAVTAASWYLDGHDPRDPLASPLFGDLEGLPPMLVHAGDHEVLLDDATGFAAALESAGVEVDLRIWPGMIHDFQIMYPNYPEAIEGTEAIAAFVRRVVG
ncbi:MAG: alpha/beta hydrolase [Acidimicrobiia bacterium]|nr:alpha/beta hydrolase [Acidimicrobiia bacterium]MYG73307.1 alpha/beta hydrolase [Acidimicrobiia bacterium]